MKVWIAFLLVMFVLASRPSRADHLTPRNAVIAAACVLVSGLLFSFRFI